MQRFHIVCFTFISASSRPDYWDPIPVDPSTQREKPIHIVDLKPDQQEYKEVLQEFNKTVSQGQGYTVIVSIQRIQTPVLYGQYIARKREMDNQNPTDPQYTSERRLFHGTSVDTTPKINLQGFNRSFSGKNGEWTDMHYAQWTQKYDIYSPLIPSIN